MTPDLLVDDEKNAAAWKTNQDFIVKISKDYVYWGNGMKKHFIVSSHNHIRMTIDPDVTHGSYEGEFIDQNTIEWTDGNRWEKVDKTNVKPEQRQRPTEAIEASQRLIEYDETIRGYRKTDEAFRILTSQSYIRAVDKKTPLKNKKRSSVNLEIANQSQEKRRTSKEIVEMGPPIEKKKTSVRQYMEREGVVQNRRNCGRRGRKQEG
eukprot:UN23727